MAFWSRKPKLLHPPVVGPDPVVMDPVATEVRPPTEGWLHRVTEGTGTPVWVRDLDTIQDGLDAWNHWSAEVANTGLWPVLIGGEFWEAVELGDSLRPISNATTAAEWLSQTLGMASPPEAVAADATDGDGSIWQSVLRDPRPNLEPDYTVEEMVEDLDAILLVPAAAGWQVPRLLAWDGAVNQDVLGPEHELVLRRWAGLYGARLMGLTRDELVLRVASPPTTKDTAVAAAFEAFAYCQDSVWQGTDTLEGLVPMIMSPAWRFWWD